MSPDQITAVIADDEAPLRTYLKTLLAQVWPELHICAEAQNGVEAVAAVSTHHPQIAFLDIRMPGLTGLQAAEAIAPMCRIVFVTAYDEYAVSAFEKEALDYLLKPVTVERLSQTVERLKKRLAVGEQASQITTQWLTRLLEQAAGSKRSSYLQWLNVQHGDAVQLIAVDDVIYFQSKDKYTAVITADREYLIRKSIRELTAQLDPDEFCPIHRATIVRLCCIGQVSRSLTGRGIIRLKKRSETLTVSRAYLSRFKQM